MRVAIEYTFKPGAEKLSAAIREAFPDAEIELTHGPGGLFTVIADGHELWNKKKKRGFGRRYPEPADIVSQLRELSQS